MTHSRRHRPALAAALTAAAPEPRAWTRKPGPGRWRRFGEAVVTGSGNVAAVRLKLDGDGDGVLLVGAGEWGKASLGRKQTGDLTQALADQVG